MAYSNRSSRVLLGPASFPLLMIGLAIVLVVFLVRSSAQTNINGSITAVAVAAPATYSAAFAPSANGTAVATSTTDFWCIAGSGSKTVFITLITLTGISGAAAIDARVNLIVRSALDTGGTPTTITAVPHDSNNAVATATVTSFAANPASLGAAVATIKGYVAVRQSSAVNQPGGPFFFLQEVWGAIRGAQPLTLRGAAQSACLNSNAVTTMSNAMVNVEWYEQ